LQKQTLEIIKPKRAKALFRRLPKTSLAIHFADFSYKNWKFIGEKKE